MPTYVEYYTDFSPIHLSDDEVRALPPDHAHVRREVPDRDPGHLAPFAKDMSLSAPDRTRYGNDFRGHFRYFSADGLRTDEDGDTHAVNPRDYSAPFHIATRVVAVAREFYALERGPSLIAKKQRLQAEFLDAPDYQSCIEAARDFCRDELLMHKDITRGILREAFREGATHIAVDPHPDFKGRIGPHCIVDYTPVRPGETVLDKGLNVIYTAPKR